MSTGEKKLFFYQDKQNEFRWTVYAANGRIIADSGEGYKNFSDCEKIAKDLFPDMKRIESTRPGQ